MTRKGILSLILILIFSLFTPLNSSINIEFKKTPISYNTISSSDYNYTVGYILIDASATTNSSYSGNWTWIANTFDWCSGNGVWEDPYIINNVSFNGGTYRHGLEIKNSQNFH